MTSLISLRECTVKYNPCLKVILIKLNLSISSFRMIYCNILSNCLPIHGIENDNSSHAIFFWSKAVSLAKSLLLSLCHPEGRPLQECPSFCLYVVGCGHSLKSGMSG